MSFHNYTPGWSTGRPTQGQEVCANNKDYFHSNVNNSENNRLFIDNSQYPEQPKLITKVKIKKSAFPSISKARESLSKILKLSEDLKNTREVLRTNIDTLTEEEWREAMKLAEEQKKEIKNLEILKDGYVDTLKKALSKRANKRARIKRQKAKIKSQKLQDERIKSEEHNKIDNWLLQMKEELQNKNKEEELKNKADIVLKDVRKRKADSKRCLALFEALYRLREAREKSAIGRGEKLSTSDAEKFSVCIGKLQRVWNLALDKYVKEEHDLSLELQEGEVTTSDVNPATIPVPNSGDTLPLWRNILFGSPDAIPQRVCEGDIKQYMDIRWGWDCFICSSEEGSTIPVGWVLPPQESNSKWKQYLTQEN